MSWVSTNGGDGPSQRWKCGRCGSLDDPHVCPHEHEDWSPEAILRTTRAALTAERHGVHGRRYADPLIRGETPEKIATLTLCELPLDGPGVIAVSTTTQGATITCPACREELALRVRGIR